MMCVGCGRALWWGLRGQWGLHLLGACEAEGVGRWWRIVLVVSGFGPPLWFWVAIIVRISQRWILLQELLRLCLFAWIWGLRSQMLLHDCVICYEYMRVLVSELIIIDSVPLELINCHHLLAIAPIHDFIVHAQVVVCAFFTILSFDALLSRWALAVGSLGGYSLIVEVLLGEGSATCRSLLGLVLLLRDLLDHISFIGGGEVLLVWVISGWWLLTEWWASDCSVRTTTDMHGAVVDLICIWSRDFLILISWQFAILTYRLISVLKLIGLFRIIIWIRSRCILRSLWPALEYYTFAVL